MQLNYIFFENKPDKKWLLAKRMSIQYAIAKLALELKGQLAPWYLDSLHSFCQCNYPTMGEHVNSVINEFGNMGKMFFIHIRKVAGNSSDLKDTFHANGFTDMVDMERDSRDVDDDSPHRSDNVLIMAGKANHRHGYKMKGNPHSIGFIKGVIEAFNFKESVAVLLISLFSYQVASSQRLVKTSPPILKSNLHEQSKQSTYFSLFKTWCDGILTYQIKGGDDDGGILCPAHQYPHGRSGELIYPLLTMYSITKDIRYKVAALKAFEWGERHVSQEDGSWKNETGNKNPWNGISVFRVIALGEALDQDGDLLTAAEKKRIQERLRAGADFVLTNIQFDTGDLNYPASAAAALAISWKVLGDEKYLKRSHELAKFVAGHFTANLLLWGEGERGPNDVTPKGFRPIDVPYNIEESLPNLATYAIITSNKNLFDTVVASMKAHLNWMLPDGGIDAGWCARQYKWTYFGSSTSEGPTGGFTLLAAKDKVFSEAALRSAMIREKFTHNGLLYGGYDVLGRSAPCIHHTIGNLKGLATAIHLGAHGSLVPGRIPLPSDKPHGVREWKDAGVLQVGVGPWRASITTRDLSAHPKRYGHPMGGGLSMLWNSATGPVAVASMTDYIRFEASNMQEVKSPDDEFVLTPRIEVIKDSIKYNNLYDTKATSTWKQNQLSAEVHVKGNLRNSAGELLPGGESAFELTYTFTKSNFGMTAANLASHAKLIFPVLAQTTTPVKYTDRCLLVRKNKSSIKISGSEQSNWKEVVNRRVFNFVPGFLALPVESNLNSNGKTWISIEIKTEL